MTPKPKRRPQPLRDGSLMPFDEVAAEWNRRTGQNITQKWATEICRQGLNKLQRNPDLLNDFLDLIRKAA